MTWASSSAQPHHCSGRSVPRTAAVLDRAVPFRVEIASSVIPPWILTVAAAMVFPIPCWIFLSLRRNLSSRPCAPGIVGRRDYRRTYYSTYDVIVDKLHGAPRLERVSSPVSLNTITGENLMGGCRPQAGPLPTPREWRARSCSPADDNDSRLRRSPSSEYLTKDSGERLSVSAVSSMVAGKLYRSGTQILGQSDRRAAGELSVRGRTTPHHNPC